MKEMRMKIMNMVKGGKSAKDAIASCLADDRMKKKMAQGGMVQEGDYAMGEETPRGLMDIMEQGDQHPVSNPEEQSAEQMLAQKIAGADMFAMGGLVQEGQSQKPTLDLDDGTEDAMDNEAKGMAMASMPLSDLQMKAISEYKMKRKFKR